MLHSGISPAVAIHALAERLCNGLDVARSSRGEDPIHDSLRVGKWIGWSLAYLYELDTGSEEHQRAHVLIDAVQRACAAMLWAAAERHRKNAARVKRAEQEIRTNRKLYGAER